MQNDNDLHGWLDAYYSFSDDRGATWQEFRLTPASFDSFNDGLNWGAQAQFLGDYIGLGRGGSQVYPCYPSTQNGDPDIYMHVVALLGACCMGDGSGQDLSEASCADAGGSFLGPGSACDEGTIGVCCIGDGSCQVVLEACCTEPAWEFLGGTTCESGSGACCLPGGCCIETTETWCNQQGGLFAEQFTCFCRLPPCVYCG